MWLCVYVFVGPRQVLIEEIEAKYCNRVRRCKDWR